ncbi:hypothetical protein EVG20_g1189 [Dentipellis fragilis]|uniref:Uncharacterized protein n=1 Tax=Dentipellis fragilis TaxID=205917 RepID=A0A4Y9ZBF1_9AGAM|nr:hypothetical protein EVG20_g1189 [Dentipellis fragilis]
MTDLQNYAYNLLVRTLSCTLYLSNRLNDFRFSSTSTPPALTFSSLNFVSDAMSSNSYSQSSVKGASGRHNTRANARLIIDSDVEKDITPPSEEKTGGHGTADKSAPASKKLARMSTGSKAPRRPPGKRAAEKCARQSSRAASSERNPLVKPAQSRDKVQQHVEEPRPSYDASEISIDDVSMFFEEGHPPTPYQLGDSDENEATDYIGHESDVDSNGNFKEEFQEKEKDNVQVYSRDDMVRIMPPLSKFYALADDRPNVLKTHLENAAKGLLKAEEHARQVEAEAALALERARCRAQTPPASQTSMSSGPSDIFSSSGHSTDASDAPSPATRDKLFKMLKDMGHEVPPKYQQMCNTANAPAVDAGLKLKVTSVKKQLPKAKPSSLQGANPMPQVVQSLPSTEPLNGCDVTDACEKDSLLVATYTNNLAKLKIRLLITRSPLTMGNFSALGSEMHFSKVNIRRLQDVVTFQHEVLRNLFNLSRCDPKMFKSITTGSHNDVHVFTVNQPGQQFPAGLVMFVFIIKAKLLTPTRYTDSLGKARHNTYVLGMPVSCEAEHAFSVLGQHLDKTGGTGLHAFSEEGLLTFNTARAIVNADGSPPVVLHNDFYVTQPSPAQGRVSSQPSDANSGKGYPMPPLQYKVHWGDECIPVWDASRYFQTGTDGYSYEGSDFDVTRLLTMPYRDPLWQNEEIPTGSFCAVHYVASAYTKEGTQHLTLNIAGVQVLAKPNK